MQRRRWTDRHTTLPTTALSRGTAVPAGPRQSPGPSPIQPSPVAASPRACRTSAPRRDTAVTRLSHGATETVWRRPALPLRPVEARLIRILVKTRMDAWHHRASRSPGISHPRQRCNTGKDAVGAGVPQKWGAVLTTTDGFTGRRRGSGEVAPRSPTTTDTDTDRTHDILRDSGAADRAASGAFFRSRNLKRGILRVEGVRSNHRCRSSGHGALGGRHARLNHPSRHGHRRIV